MMSSPSFRIGDIAQVVRGVTYKKPQALTEPARGHVPLLRATNIGRRLDFLNLLYVPESIVKQEQHLRAGDIVLAASSGSLGVVGKAAGLRADWEGTFGAFCYVVRPDQTLVRSRYLELFMQSPRYRKRVSQLAAGTNINNLKRSHIESFELPRIGLEEQDALIAAIDKQFTRLDSAENTLRTGSTKVGRYRASVLQSAIRGQLIPGTFTPTVLSDVASMRLGKMLSAASRKGVDPVPYLRNINVRWGRIDTDDLLFMDFTDREMKEFQLQVGDVLVCEGGEPGRAAVWNDQAPGALFQKALHRVRTDTTKLLPAYLVIHLQADALTGKLSPYFTGSTIKHFTGVALKKYVLQIPDVESQARIVAEVERRLSVLDVLASQVRTDLRRVQGLRQAILDRAFSGERPSEKVA